ncbi:MAG: DUF58 domain-containing protein [Deltaproteobacteria bacterium]|nr:DUF58 domain-containing protein [Deltaproteobacteria bacterium]
MPERALDAELAERVAALRLDTTHVVEGVMSGSHRSPHRGASVVFVEHRDYRPGDDLRLLDWRAFARNDRHVTKRFEQETELSLHLWLDASASMRFGSGTAEKARCAATLLATFATLAHAQGDGVGLVRFDDAIRTELPARTSPAHLRTVLDALALPPTTRAHTDLSALASTAERLVRRGIVIVASDLLDLSEHALDAIEHVARRGHDVRVFQVLHRDELELPHDGPAIFEGLEDEPAVEADPAEIRAAYRAELEAHVEGCRKRLLAVGARHRVVATDEPLAAVVSESLLERSRSGPRTPGAMTGARARWA